MNAGGLINFAFEDQLCRVVMREGEPWFVAKDVCRVLGIVNHRDAVSALDDDEKGVGSTDTLGGEQDMLVVSESGLYTLVVRSRAATTQGTLQHRFRKWVFGVVIPEIRRTGKYIAEASEDWDWEAMGLKLQMVREARLQHGRKVSAALWIKLGLPMPDEEQPVASPSHGVQFVQNFFAERVDEGGDGRVQASELKRAYDAWAEGEGLPVMTDTAFGRTVTALGWRKVRSMGRVYYLGMRLKHRSVASGD